MNRRHAMKLFTLLGLGSRALAANAAAPQKLVLSDAEWKKRLTREQYDVLRGHGTEWARSSPLNNEHRRGTYHCVGCDLPLFSSEAKFESGTGWPSFHTPLPDALGFSTDYKLIVPRKEYHCARCDGHHGHV